MPCSQAEAEAKQGSHGKAASLMYNGVAKWPKSIMRSSCLNWTRHLDTTVICDTYFAKQTSQIIVDLEVPRLLVH
jgi:hypothetical protein